MKSRGLPEGEDAAPGRRGWNGRAVCCAVCCGARRNSGGLERTGSSRGGGLNQCGGARGATATLAEKTDIIKNLSVPPPQDIFHKHKHRESADNADSEPGGERMELKEEKSDPTGTYSMALRDVLTVTHIHENNDDDSKKTSRQ
ncbi:long-chain fatty acid--CoA ligase [Sesbania bispinosa]|nr:long-chain fatty acid--CoA ligase [Sesbania bispinosa]